MHTPSRSSLCVKEPPGHTVGRNATKGVCLLFYSRSGEPPTFPRHQTVNWTIEGEVFARAGCARSDAFGDTLMGPGTHIWFLVICVAYLCSVPSCSEQLLDRFPSSISDNQYPHWPLPHRRNNALSIHFHNGLQVDLAIPHSKIQLKSALKMPCSACAEGATVADAPTCTS
uniref:Uncharacterized protein n=1 Tax=Sphaerodactylus townsendi TaxID=933632 RepID=A0ACB8EVM3_9SAUR